MIRRVSLLLAVLLVGCENSMEVDQTSRDSSQVIDAVPLQSVEFLDMQGMLPAGWINEPPSSRMRLLQFRVPGPVPAEDAQFVIYYFGLGQGGSPAANIARWRSQFTSAEGSAVEPTIETTLVGDLKVSLVALTGDYARGVGMGSDTAIPGQTLLAAIVESVQGNLYVQLHGPMQTVALEREAFQAFIFSLTALNT